jgi:tRNA/rRNA methyltransferase
MNLPQTNTSLFQHLRIVLVETSHPGNVGAAARAMKTMGFSDLVLVNPRFPDVLQSAEAIAMCSGALDVLEGAKIVPNIETALADCRFVAAVSARLREFSPPIETPRHLSEKLLSIGEQPIALVFGNERFGLPNEIVSNANALINIPANPAYSSLNLAQAVQVLCYEFRMAALTEQPSVAASISEIGFRGELAAVNEIEGMYQHLEQALVQINFLDPDSPKKLMPRLKRLFARTQLEKEEVNILRGVAKKILDHR